MKTLLITPDLFGTEGGIARIMRLYLRALAELGRPGDTLQYCTLLDAGDTRSRARALAGPALTEFTNCQGSRLKFAGAVLQRALDADLVVCGHLHFLPLARLAALARPALRYCVVAHGIEVWRPFSYLEKAALRRADRVFCVSEYTRRQILRFDGKLNPARLVVVPNTFDPQFRDSEIPRSPRAQEGVDDPAPRILVVSRLVSSDPYKGVDTMIEAMPGIRAHFPAAQLRIVGGGDDRPRLEQIAQTHGVADAVRFLGAIDDAMLRAEYEACDLFALPSRKEGFGLVYLEAMSYGKACLAARAGGAPEVVTHEVGELVEYGNVEQIATAVRDLIAFPRSGAAVRARAAEFSFPRFKERLAAHLPR